MPERPKLSIPQQIQHMENKGITYNIYSKEQAENFLGQSTYFFKIKAYVKNYPINPKTGKYKGVDFAYLMELSVLDMLLRRLILHASLDIEHYLKVRLMNRLNENSEDDGYRIVYKFFQKYPEIEASVYKKANNSYCKDLVNKLQKDGFALWNVIEVLTFGDFIRLYKLYDQENGSIDASLVRSLFPVRCLRNAAAHNNCLLNSLLRPYSLEIKPYRYLNSYIGKIPGVRPTSREKKLSNPVIHDFVALLYVYRQVVSSEKTVEHFSQELHGLFEDRMQKHAEYFTANESIVSSYVFVMKIINHLFPCEM